MKNDQKIVNLRQRVDDWEADSIIYPNKKAINRLEKLPVETITFDNGSENTLHEEIGEKLGYFIPNEMLQFEYYFLSGCNQI